MKILTFATYYLPGFKGGGPIKTISNLADATKKSHLDFFVVTADRDLGDLSCYPNITQGKWNKVGSAQVYYLSNSLASYLKIYKLIRSFRNDCIYLNSFFSFKFSIFPQLCAILFGVNVVGIK